MRMPAQAHIWAWWETFSLCGSLFPVDCSLCRVAMEAGITETLPFSSYGALNENAPTGSYVRILDPYLVELLGKDCKCGLVGGGLSLEVNFEFLPFLS